MPAPKKKNTTAYCAAIDLGATSGRVILGHWNGRRLTLTEAHRFPNAFRTMGGHDYWDLPGLWEQIVAGLRKAAALLPRRATLASVGVDTWGVDHVLTDRAGRPVYPTFAYRDDRTQAGLKRLARSSAALSQVYQATGIPNVFYNTSLQLAEAVATHPGIANLAEHCLFLPDYFNFLLSGRMANEITIASTAQLLDACSFEWSQPTLDHFGIPARWFSTPVFAGTKLGRVRDLDFLEGTQVIAVPGHDTACAYDAMPAHSDGNDLYLSSGTWSLVGYESNLPLLGPKALAARIANERTGSGRYRPLTNVIGLWLLEGTMKDFATRPANPEEWTALLEAAAALPAPTALLDVKDPAFMNPTSMKAAIDDQLKKRRVAAPATLAAYTRLVCDSLGRGHADAKARFEELRGAPFRRIVMVGGGARNRLLCQATADASGLPVVAYNLEGSATGNIANQLVALGHVRDLQTFRDLIGPSLESVTYQPKAT